MCSQNVRKQKREKEKKKTDLSTKGRCGVVQDDAHTIHITCRCCIWAKRVHVQLRQCRWEVQERVRKTEDLKGQTSHWCCSSNVPNLAAEIAASAHSRVQTLFIRGDLSMFCINGCIHSIVCVNGVFLFFVGSSRDWLFLFFDLLFCEWLILFAFQKQPTFHFHFVFTLDLCVS